MLQTDKTTLAVHLWLEDISVAVFDERECLGTKMYDGVRFAQVLCDDSHFADWRLKGAHRRRQALSDNLGLFIKVSHLWQRRVDRV